jgi:TatA/E family protein of Tat protein translocase
MFGPLGLPEVLFILVLALLIFGPRKLPEIGRTLGKAMGEFRRATTELKRSINTEIALEDDDDRPKYTRSARQSVENPDEPEPRIGVSTQGLDIPGRKPAPRPDQEAAAEAVGVGAASAGAGATVARDSGTAVEESGAEEAGTEAEAPEPAAAPSETEARDDAGSATATPGEAPDGDAEDVPASRP